VRCVAHYEYLVLLVMIGSVYWFMNQKVYLYGTDKYHYS
jgi:hypothetical protein